MAKGAGSKTAGIKTGRGSTKSLTFSYAIRSFKGYLEGTEKSLHTIKSYQCDLNHFKKFLENEQRQSKVLSIRKLTLRDLENYRAYLKKSSLRSNTRRRMLMTVRKFFSYLNQRKKVPLDISSRLATPGKIERVPFTYSTETLIREIRKLSEESTLELRNKCLLWVLAETGCQVSEVVQLREGSWTKTHLNFSGKNSRIVAISQDLYVLIEKLAFTQKKLKWLFEGHNRYGGMKTPITARGVELLVREYGKRLGFNELTPRIFRHSAVVYWNKIGKTKKEIREVLGLKTDYAFRVYDPLFRQGV